MRYDRKKLQEFYSNLLTKDFMPFWKKACDCEYGGVYTCFSNDGSRLLSTDKYVWSQGRFLWMLARYIMLIDQGLAPDPDREFYFTHAAKTYEFIRDNCILPQDEGVCAYLTERDGTKKETIPGRGYYTSFFVDCFVIMGFAEYAKLTGKAEMFEQALALYDRTRAYLDRGEIVSEPYPQPKGFEVQANYMIMTNVTFVLHEAAQKLEHSRAGSLLEDAAQNVRKILDCFYSPAHGLLREHIALDSADDDTLFARYIAPGHAVESMWFCREVAIRAGMDEAYFDKIRAVIKNSINTGWDEKYGGLLRNTGYDGEKPQGRLLGDPQEDLVLETWDSKLWWPHSECLYATLLCYEDTGDEQFLRQYEMMSDYAFRVYPNPDKEIGEWTQILDRKGRPMEKLVALPVKDPYHIVRNFILIVELMAEKLSG